MGIALLSALAIPAVVTSASQAAFPGPNGRLAFTAFAGDTRDVFTINRDGSLLRNRTNNPATDADAGFSPDGSQIVFFSVRDGKADIYRMQRNGSGVTRLTNDPVGAINPSFGPDGRIVFTSFRSGNADIWVMNGDGSGQTQLTEDRTDDSEPEFSPDGSRIAFQSFRAITPPDPPSPEVFIMDADGTNERQITISPRPATPPAGPNNALGNADPSFSPDGTRIAFASRRDASNNEIYTMNADGSGPAKRLTEDTFPGGGFVDVQPVFSPDGTRIAFRSNRPVPPSTDRIQQIYTMNATDGTGVMQVTRDGSTKDLDDWGVDSNAPFDPPPPVDPPTAPPAPPASGGSITDPFLPPLPPPAPPLTRPQRVTEVDAFAGWAAWSAFEPGVGYNLVVRRPDGGVSIAPVEPRSVPFDVDLGPSEDSDVVAAYSRCQKEPDGYGAGGVLLRAKGRGCDIFRLDLPNSAPDNQQFGRESKLRGASTNQASEYLPSISKNRVGFARVYEQRKGRRGDLPYLYARPLKGGTSKRLAGGSRGRSGLPGPTGLDLFGRRLAFTWEWRLGNRLRSELRQDTLGGRRQLIRRVGSRESAPANILTPSGDRGRIYAGERRLLESGHENRLLRFNLRANALQQALLEGPPLTGLGVDNGDFVLATADDPAKAPLCGPAGCEISLLELTSGD